MNFPPDARVPIAQLQPSLDSSDAFVEGLVTLIWPYSSSDRSTSILLVEPDFRLRPNGGQVRISFTGASAQAIAKSGLTGGDRLSVRLTAAVWLPEGTGGTALGRGTRWQLQYGQSLTLQISQEAREPFLVKVDSSSPILAPQDVVRTPPQSPLESRYPLPLHITNESQDAAKTWSSPAFLKRKSLAETSFFDAVCDPFIGDGEDEDDRPRKKARFGRRSDQWTFLERTPSPEVESEPEDSESRNQSVQKHGDEEQVILNGVHSASVRNTDLSETINDVVVTQHPGSPDNRGHIEPPTAIATVDYSDTRQNANGIPPAFSGLPTGNLLLERGGAENVPLREDSEQNKLDIGGIALSASGNDEASKQPVEADGSEEALSLQFNAYEEQNAKVNDEVDQEQQISLETKDHENLDLRGFKVDEDTRVTSPLNATILDGGLTSAPGILGTGARSDELSGSGIQDAAAILDMRGTVSVLEDKSNDSDNDHEVDKASSVRTEEEADYFDGEAGEREYTVDSLVEVRCEDSVDVGATALDKEGKNIEVVDIDSGDDQVEAVLDEEDDESVNTDDERVDLLEYPAKVLSKGSEGSEESYEPGNDSVASVAQVTRSGSEHLDGEEESERESEFESESDEAAEIEHAEAHSQKSKLEYLTLPPNEDLEECEGSQPPVQDHFMSFVDASDSIAEHDHTAGEQGIEHDSNEDMELVKSGNDDQISISISSDELLKEQPDSSRRSDSAEAFSLVKPTISETGEEHVHIDEVVVAETDEDLVIEDLEDEMPMNLSRYPEETSNKAIDISVPLKIDQATKFARAATSLNEHDRTDGNDEELGSDVDGKLTNLGDKRHIDVHSSIISSTTVPEEISSSDAEEVVSIAESIRFMADDGREGQPDNSSYSALARNAIQQAELQEGITMDESLQLPPENPSSPPDDRMVHQDYSDGPQEKIPFPFTPQPSGLSVLYPEGTLVGRHGPSEGVIVNPTSSFSLPDYDSVPGDLNTPLGEQLITPMATQNAEPQQEEDDDDEMKSQVDLDFDDEISNGNVDHLVEDDTASLPLPITTAASRPLVGILRNLGPSSEVRTAKSGNDDISGHTELWSDAGASKQSLQKEDRSSTPESERIESSVDYDEHTDAKSQKRPSQHDVSDSTNVAGDQSKHSTDETLRQASQLGFRTQFSYFAPLSTIEQHYNSTVDVLATVVSSTKASRAIKGPRDYNQTVYITDSSSSLGDSIPSYTTAQIFRPYKQALPVLQTGDALLLRNFKVQMQKHEPMLLSTEYSAWAVFRKDTDVQIHGPHVEFGDEEAGFAETLTEWWHSLSSEVQSQLLSSVPQPEPSNRGRPKGKKKEKRMSEVVHELRDGTKYTDGGADMNSIHQLRDGTMYADDKVL
ncbi:hypothetical protein MMC26_005404 [Xylographa opegraphella]|nr:hypothetical protein [Xylographa opegraphella]